MSANFPGHPQIGNTVTIENIKRRWTGTTWVADSSTVRAGVVQSNNGTIDLSKGNYHKIAIGNGNSSVTVSFTNVPSGSSKWFLELNVTASYTITWPAAVVWTEDTAPTTIANQTLILEFYTPNGGTTIYGVESINKDTSPTSYGINVRTAQGKVTSGMSTTSQSGGGLPSDGSNLYVVGYSGDQFFYRWALGTPFQLDTIPASYTERSNVLNVATPTGFYIKPDGTRMFWTDYGTIKWATMSSPNNMSTFGSVSSASGIIPGGLCFGMTFKHDGTSFYIAGTDDVIYQHQVSTPWDPSTKTTGTSGSGTFNPSGVQYPFGMFFNYNGTKLFLASNDSTVYEHNLSTAWQISSASNPAVATFALSTVQSTPLYDLVNVGTDTYGIFLSPDETKLYLFVRGGNVIELVLNTPGTLVDGVRL
jgi:hypothetical protein